MERKFIFPKITDLSSAEEFVDRRLHFLKKSHEDKGQVILHFIPLAQKTEVPLNRLLDDLRKKPLIHGGRFRWIEDGLKIFQIGPNKEVAHAICYFDGPVEIWDTTVLDYCSEDGTPYIPSTVFEKEMVYSMERILDLVRKEVIALPALLVLSLLNVKGFEMATRDRWLRDRFAIESDDIIIAKVIENSEPPAYTILRYFFDRIWNACGHEGSRSYDDKGNWNPEA